MYNIYNLSEMAPPGYKAKSISNGVVYTAESDQHEIKITKIDSDTYIVNFDNHITYLKMAQVQVLLCLQLDNELRRYYNAWTLTREEWWDIYPPYFWDHWQIYRRSFTRWHKQLFLNIAKSYFMNLNSFSTAQILKRLNAGTDDEEQVIAALKVLQGRGKLQGAKGISEEINKLIEELPEPVVDESGSLTDKINAAKANAPKKEKKVKLDENGNPIVPKPKVPKVVWNNPENNKREVQVGDRVSMAPSTNAQVKEVIEAEVLGQKEFPNGTWISVTVHLDPEAANFGKAQWKRAGKLEITTYAEDRKSDEFITAILAKIKLEKAHAKQEALKAKKAKEAEAKAKEEAAKEEAAKEAVPEAAPEEAKK